MLSFHADPVVGDEFPRGLEPRRAPRFLPLPNSVGTNLVKRFELGLRPMRMIFCRSGHWRETGHGKRVRI